MPLKRAVTEFGKTYKDRFALRTYPGTSVPIFIFILGWSRTKPRVTLSAQTMHAGCFAWQLVVAKGGAVQHRCLRRGQLGDPRGAGSSMEARIRCASDQGDEAGWVLPKR